MASVERTGMYLQRVLKNVSLAAQESHGDIM